MNKKKAIFLIVPFLIITFSIGIINLLIEDKEMSKAENRNLQKMPTIQNIKEKNFTRLFDTYYTDQFLFRDLFIKADIKWQLFTKKSNIKGFYITDDNWIMGGTETTKKTNSDYENTVNKIKNIECKVKESSKKFYYTSLPHKVNTLTFKYPKKYVESFGMENHELFLSMLKDEEIDVIDVGKYFLNKFDKDKLEDFYFKTDHHWNAKGTYEAFRYIIDDLNDKKEININLNDYNYKTDYVEGKEFLGSYNKNLYGLFSKEETVPYVYMDRKYNNKYYIREDGKFKEVDEKNIFASGIYKSEINYESAYMANIGYCKVVNNDAKTDKKIMLIRDSYQAPLTLLLSDIFEEVEIVDLRMADMKLNDIIENSDSDMVIMMFNNGLNVDEMLSNIKR